MGDDVERIRSLNRENLEKERKIVREAFVNNRRRELATIENRTYHENDVTLLVSSLAAGSSDVETLSNLKNAIIQNEDNISAFFNVRGGLHALVGHFTGNDASRQLVAGECLCNISLGPKKSCLAVAKAAGAYLVTYLDSANVKLVEVCAWTLGNLAASDVKVASILKAQGFVEKVIPLLNSNYPGDVVDSAAYALGHFLPANGELVEYFQKEEMIRHIAEHRVFSDYVLKLIFILSSDTLLVPIFSSFKMLSRVLTHLVATVNRPNWADEVTSVDCLVKIAANLSCEEGVLDSELGALLDENFRNCIVNLLTSSNADLKMETCWLFGNILNSRDNNSGWKGVFHSYLMYAQKFVYL